MQIKYFRVVGVLLVALLAVAALRYVNQTTKQEFYYQGYTMGKIQYNIKYLAKKQMPELAVYTDSLLVAFNKSLSTYITDSEISRFNKAEKQFKFESRFFFPVLQKSLEVFQASEGFFDPTVMPLINFWGFGYAKPQNMDTTQIPNLLERVGFANHIRFDSQQVSKSRPDIELDFSAIAKGYAVDVVAELLRSQGIQDYMVEIGGEAVCSGKNGKGQVWRMGITNPNYKQEGQIRRLAAIELQDRAMATSGNYEKFYISNGKKYSHTINPKTGFPVEHNLLSATVLAQDCMTADAWATGFMAMGIEKAKAIVSRQKHMDAFFVYDSLGHTRTYATDGFNVLD